MNLLKTTVLMALFFMVSSVYGQMKMKPTNFEGVAQLHGTTDAATQLAKSFAMQDADKYCFPDKSLLATVWTVKLDTSKVSAEAGFYCSEIDDSQVRCQRIGSSYAIRCCDSSGNCWID